MSINSDFLFVFYNWWRYIIVCLFVLTAGLERAYRASDWFISQYQLSDGQVFLGMFSASAELK